VVMTSPGSEELIRSLLERARDSRRRDNCEPVGDGFNRGTGDVDRRSVNATWSCSGDCDTLLDLICGGTGEGELEAALNLIAPLPKR